MLQACLGLHFDPAKHEVQFRRPRLPVFIDQLAIRSLRLGDARAHILLRRSGEDVSIRLLRDPAN